MRITVKLAKDPAKEFSLAGATFFGHPHKVKLSRSDSSLDLQSIFASNTLLADFWTI